MTSIGAIENLLARYVPLVKEMTGKNVTLERMQHIMAILGNPEKNLKVIHIAGTSGKTSTAYFIASMLHEAGAKTGLIVSPHVDSVLERVQVDMRFLSADEFYKNLQECVRMIESAEILPTYFELMTAFAYWYFAKVGVQYVVAETGLGGLQDATNVAIRPDKICVITDIGMDHMQVLGSTRTEIAAQKAGIIHEHNEVLMYRQADEVMGVVAKRTEQMRAILHIYDQAALQEQVDVRGMPTFQQRNWLLAFEAFKLIQSRDDLPTLDARALASTRRVRVPARMDIAHVKDTLIIMDGAHNEQKTQAFVESFHRMFPGKKVPVLLSLKQGKEFTAVLPLLKPITSVLITTTFQNSQDLPTKPIDPSELARAAEKFGFKNVATEPDQQRAYALLLEKADSLAIVTGSFYLIGQLRGSHPELSKTDA